MANETKTAGQFDRRRFLGTAGLALGAAGATAAGTPASAAVVEPRTDGQGGYQETEHVQTYYDTARF
jgi:nitrous oxide reductase